MRSPDRCRPFRVAAAALGIAVAASVGGGASGSAQDAFGASIKQAKAVGKVVDILDDPVLLRGAVLTRGGVPLYAGDVFDTKRGGSVIFKLKLRNTTCTLDPGSVLKIRPAKLVVTRAATGGYWCFAGKSKDAARFEAGGAKIHAKDPLFGVRIGRGRRIVVKVARGLVVVTGSGGPAAAVIVGRKQQVVVPPGRDPLQPTAIHLEPADRRSVTRLERPLAKVRDTTAPATTIEAMPAKAVASTDASFTFSASERNVAFSCALDGGDFHPCGPPKEYVDLAEGGHTFAVRGTDETGNTGAAATYAWTIDLEPPTTTITSSQPAATSAATVTFTFTADESGAAFACQLDASAFVPCTSPHSYSGLTDGTHTFVVRASDAAGNTGPAVSYSWTVITRAPVTTITSQPSVVTQARSASFTFTADRPTVTFACQLDSSTFASCTSPKSYTGLVDGTHTFGVRATDIAGNIGTVATYTWTIDTRPPTTTITNAPPGSAYSSSASFSFTANEANVTFACQLDGRGFSSCTSPKTYSGLTLGTHTFAVRATDLAGNVGAAAGYTWTIVVRPPAFSSAPHAP
jgi:hypothetical protein